MFSPSLGTIEDCPFNDLPDDQVFDELSYDILDSVLEDIRDCGEKVLSIMDDVVNDMKRRFEQLPPSPRFLMINLQLCKYATSHWKLNCLLFACV